uniref:Uncharacterized protein n=1 Tax=Parascaris equorum TaxID=6256 RepID=A0A914RHL8_PAREQ
MFRHLTALRSKLFYSIPSEMIDSTVEVTYSNLLGYSLPHNMRYLNSSMKNQSLYSCCILIEAYLGEDQNGRTYSCYGRAPAAKRGRASERFQNERL